MTHYGLTVDVASSGFEAIDKIKSGEVYDIVFMDHMMPKMDGLEAAKEMRIFGYKHPIVALTANAVVGQADIFLKNGFNDFISKPIDIRQLNSTLNKLIRDKQSPETIAKAQKEKDAAGKMQASASAITAELLSIFAKDAKRLLPQLEYAAQNAENLSDDELSVFTTNVHGMKSALANIGETTLSQMARTLEIAGRTEDKNAMATHAMNFVNALRGITAWAEDEGANKNIANTDENPEYLREQMKIIANACKELDEETASNAINVLKTMSWTAQTAEVLDKISDLMLRSEFDDAAAAAESMSAQRLR
jgi:CheY-like chemotaxis protein/HPt (histidine-containing phosphotransfer) domain-containing protein